MEQEHINDPFQFQYTSSTRTFSLRTRLLAIALVFIFVAIPLHEINEHTFQVNTIHVTYVFSCLGPFY